MIATAESTRTVFRTHSAMSCHKFCPRKYQLRYEVGLVRDREATPLRLGSAIHKGIDLFQQGKTQDEAIVGATASYEVIPAWANNDEALNDWLLEREIVAQLLAGYFWRWSTDQIEIIASEKSFRLPIINPETGRPSNTDEQAGKMDAIIRLADGRKALKETKTTGDSIDPGSDYWVKLRIDHQISQYFNAARIEHPDLATVYYDVIHKPDIQPKLLPVLDDQGRKIVLDADGNRVLKTNIKKDGTPGAGHGEPMQSGSTEKGWVVQQRRETVEEYGRRLLADIEARPDFYYARREIPRLDADLEEFRWELWDQHRIMADARRTNRFPRNTAACSIMGRCEYLDLCSGGYDPNSGIAPAGFKFTGEVHPELELV